MIFFVSELLTNPYYGWIPLEHRPSYHLEQEMRVVEELCSYKQIGHIISAFVASMYETDLSERITEIIGRDFKYGYSIEDAEHWIETDNFPSFGIASLNGFEYENLEEEEKMLLENEEYVKDAIMDIYMSI